MSAYILDSGIRFTHQEFGGRAVSGPDYIDGGTADDCNGHGTHVAGTVGGATYGVAKGVRLVAVRVLDCRGSGADSGVIAAIDWVSAHATKPAVANMSLITRASESMDQAVKNSIAAGISYAVAAGNGSAIGLPQDACKYSPARVPNAMTISGTTATDAKLSYANYGPCVDWFAPADKIVSAAHQDDTAMATKSGTSMGTPHTTGVAAQYLQTNPAVDAQAVRDVLYANTTKNQVTSSNTANNHLLFTNY